MASSKKKCKVVVLAGALTVSLFGCGTKKVDYTIEADTTASSGNAAEQENEVSLKELVKTERYAEEYQVNVSDSSLKKIKLYAEVTVPDELGMDVLNVNVIPFDAEYKKKVINSVFDSNITSFDASMYTPGALDFLIKRERANLNWYQELRDRERNNPDYVEADYDDNWIRELLDEYEAAKANMPDDFFKPNNINSNGFVGDVDGKSFRLVFSDSSTEDGKNVNNLYAYNKYEAFSMKKIHYSYEYANDVCPAAFKDVEGVAFSYGDEDVENTAGITEDKANVIGKEFLAKLGITNLEPYAVHHIMWDDSMNNSNCIPYGYCIEYELSYNNQFLSLAIGEKPEEVAGAETRYRDFIFNTINAEISYVDGDAISSVAGKNQIYSPGASALLFITDDGVIYADVENPVEYMTAVGNVKLIDSDQAKKIFEDVYIANPESYYSDVKYEAALNFYSFCLRYERVSDEDINKYSYIPVWEIGMSDDSMYVNRYCVWINAIDGTPIDIFDNIYRE